MQSSINTQKHSACIEEDRLHEVSANLLDLDDSIVGQNDATVLTLFLSNDDINAR
jgi:hypothetical protein